MHSFFHNVRNAVVDVIEFRVKEWNYCQVVSEFGVKNRLNGVFELVRGECFVSEDSKYFSYFIAQFPLCW